MGEKGQAQDAISRGSLSVGGEPNGAWDELRRRLEASRTALRRRLEPSPEAMRDILKVRAAELAQGLSEEAGTDSRLEIVEFMLAHERYGVECGFVREILPLKTLTPVPCTPPFVLGVTNVRGEVLSVIDLKRFFDLPGEALTDMGRVIVLRSDSMEFGILADAVVGARLVPLDDIDPPLPTLTDVRGEYLKGVSKERLAILDAARILADGRIVVDKEA